MPTVYLSRSLSHLAPLLRLDRDLLRAYGLHFTRVAIADDLPPLSPSDFLLWAGDNPQLPPLPPAATGQIRARAAGGYGLVRGRSPGDVSLLISRWDEVEAAGKHVAFTGSVAAGETTDDVAWVLDRLQRAHSHSYGRQVDWAGMEGRLRQDLAQAETHLHRFQAWECLFASLRDSHTRLLRLGDVRRVHAGVFGRFLGPHRFLIARVHDGSAGRRAGLAPGVEVTAVNSLPWPAFLKQQERQWACSSPQLRHACRPFIAWHQPAGSALQLQTSVGERRLEFGDASYSGFFHWLYPEAPEPLQLHRLAPGRYSLRLQAFASAHGEDLAETYERLFGKLPPDAELLLDLRGNAGGNRIAATCLLEMLLPPGAVISRRRGRVVGEGFTRWTCYRSKGKPRFAGPLRVRMDALCASTTEMVLAALQSSGRAVLTGACSAGASGNPRTYCSAGGVLFTGSSWQETLADGTPIEGRGIASR